MIIVVSKKILMIIGVVGPLLNLTREMKDTIQ